MLKKRNYILNIIVLVCLLIFTGCSSTKQVKNEEVKEFTNSVLQSNKKVKDLKFYFSRPDVRAEVVYDGDLDQEDFENLIDEFKKLIDVDFMQKVGDEYNNGSRPDGFNADIYVDEKKEESFDYQINTEYNKTNIVNEDPENIDAYKTWHIYSEKGKNKEIELE